MMVNKKEENLPLSVNENVGKFTYLISRWGSKKKVTLIPKRETGKYRSFVPTYDNLLLLI